MHARMRSPQAHVKTLVHCSYFVHGRLPWLAPSLRLYGVSAMCGAAGVNGASRPDIILDPHAQRLALAIGEPALPREPEGGAVVAALAALAVRLHAVETASVDCE